MTHTGTPTATFTEMQQAMRAVAGGISQVGGGRSRGEGRSVGEF